jgi:shikimate dehydrogenase
MNENRKFGLIGRSLKHSYSPAIHSMISGYEYRLCPLEPDELADFVENTDLDGFNVTIPSKKAVIPFCSELSPRAKATGSVNTMLRLPGGGWRGENTDYDGFLRLLGDDAVAFCGKLAMILGDGGAAATVRAVLDDLGIRHETLRISRYAQPDMQARHHDAELIINATPIGMYPENGKSPVDPGDYPACRLVLDLIYNPAKTALMLKAGRLGIPARGGLLMLCAQGVSAAELFLGQSLPRELAGSIADRIRRDMLNVLLIGMPGCGKTTIGRRLAELTDRELLDTDVLIRKKTGMDIPEIFEKFGEAYFRELETGVLREASKESGKIIATGGGVVTAPQNLDLIRQNSICIFLDREKEKLDISGRPLSRSVGIDELYRRRIPLYRSWADLTFRVDDPDTTAENIKRELGL